MSATLGLATDSTVDAVEFTQVTAAPVSVASGSASSTRGTEVSAETTIEPPSGMGRVVAVEAIRSHLPKNDPSVKLKAVQDTDLFQIVVSSSDRDQAITRANDLTFALQDALNKEGKGHFKIWERAVACSP